MAKMNKQEFAIRLLFWLTPWPLSKALPRALRIYYFGPGAAPPPYLFPLGFFDPGFIPGPDFVWPPGWEYWQDIGPFNPFDPYVPGPGDTIKPSHPSYPAAAELWYNYTSDDYWEQIQFYFTWDGTYWDLVGGWGAASIRTKAGSTWEEGFRPSKIKFTYLGPANSFLLLDTLAGEILSLQVCNSGTAYDLDFSADHDLRELTLLDPGGGEHTKISAIEFLD